MYLSISRHVLVHRTDRVMLIIWRCFAVSLAHVLLSPSHPIMLIANKSFSHTRAHVIFHSIYENGGAISRRRLVATI